ncbi:MAG: GNAT family N-acetyltransferase [Desulfurococcales archaeon]|nr:GNAT family N-acetyltransferase [Desulfurococcales archaeon]
MTLDCSNLDLRIEHPYLGALRARSPRPEDRDALVDFLRKLSAESIYHRFFRLLRDPREVVDKMLGGKDTLYCIILEGPQGVIACGEAYRTIWPDVAEPAVTVLDRHQGQGLGTLVVMLLAACALSRGIRRFRAVVFRENTPIRRITEKLAPRIVDDYGDSLVVEMDLEESAPTIREALARWGIDADP